MGMPWLRRLSRQPSGNFVCLPFSLTPSVFFHHCGLGSNGKVPITARLDARHNFERNAGTLDSPLPNGLSSRIQGPKPVGSIALETKTTKSAERTAAAQGIQNNKCETTPTGDGRRPSRDRPPGSTPVSSASRPARPQDPWCLIPLVFAALVPPALS